MSETSLQSIFAFNRELIALASTGLPLDVGLRGRESIENRLESVNSSLSDRVGRGQSIEQAIAESPDLPPRYRTALWAWLHCEDPTVALNGVTFHAEAQQSLGRGIGRTLFYPLIILSLAYLAFLCLCGFTSPSISAIYRQLMVEPSFSASFLASAREWMAVWGLLFPVLLIGGLFWWRIRWPKATWSWVPGSGRYYRSMHNANLAIQLATLLESGRSLDESISLIRPMYGAGQQPSNTTEPLPALMQWAVTTDLGAEPLPNVLRLIAESYRQTANRQQQFWRVVMPTVAGALLGGLIVLAYGLGLFLPITQLLREISMPGGV